MNLVETMEMKTAGSQGFSIFEPAKGKTEAQKMADFARVTGGEPIADAGDDEQILETAGAIEQQEEVDTDLDAAQSSLAANGWSADELSTLPREAVLKMASKMRPAQVPEPVQEQAPVIDADIDLEGLERSLEGEIGKKATRLLMDGLAKPLAAKASASAASSAQVRIEAAVQQNIRLYPELARESVRRAAVEAAVRTPRKGETDAQALRRALVDLYGDRKAEMRAQTSQQMSAPGRPASRPAKPTRDQANIAALAQLEKTGSRTAALEVKRKLGFG